MAYKGDAAETLRKILAGYMSVENHYARYVLLTQSSGTGKSRMIDELAKTVLCIPICLGDSQVICKTAVSPALTIPSSLNAGSVPSCQYRNSEIFAGRDRRYGSRRILVRCQAFLHAVFEVVNNRLKAIDDDQSSMLSY